MKCVNVTFCAAAAVADDDLPTNRLGFNSAKAKKKKKERGIPSLTGVPFYIARSTLLQQ